MESFAHRTLKRRIAAAGMSVERFAERIGVDRGTVYRWIRGQAAPNARILPLIAKTLGCGIGSLFTPTKDAPP